MGTLNRQFRISRSSDPSRIRLGASAGLVALLGVAGCVGAAPAAFGFRQNGALTGPRGPARQPFLRNDPGAVALLRQMLHPLVDYAADEETWVAQGGGMTSRQTVKGDTHGNVVRHYVSPDSLRGDVMLTGPNRYAYYRASTRTLTEVPPAGGDGDERDKRIVEGIRQHIFVARRTGSETVAGVAAAIVLVTPVSAKDQGFAKFWIDPTTHIRLKIEIANAANARISTSELRNLVVGAAANVTPRDFQRAQFGPGAAREVIRQRVASFQDAIPQLLFHPLEPGNLPDGFRLAGLQVVKRPARVGLFLRFSDGIDVFTLAEHRIRSGQRPRPGAPAAALTHWYFPAGSYEIDVVYRGHLPALQEQAVRQSMQPVR